MSNKHTLCLLQVSFFPILLIFIKDINTNSCPQDHEFKADK